ncbi:MAG: tetratricopeptide repeat protein [Candidatus Eremiobacteraeota bacterium]|nr:tetratricopeptide repeat protein [Candidatus Eremiobacteraeota bacterium]
MKIFENKKIICFCLVAFLVILFAGCSKTGKKVAPEPDYRINTRKSSSMTTSIRSQVLKLQEKGKSATAIELAEKAFGDDPENIDLLLLLARLYFDNRQVAKAILVLNDFLGKHPGNSDVLQYKLESVRDLGMHDELERTARALLLNPEITRDLKIKALMALGDVDYCRDGDYDSAREYYNRALKLSPGNPHILLKLAEVAGAEQEFDILQDLVMTAWEKKDSLDKEGLVTLYYWIGHTHVFFGRTREAEQAYKKALELDPEGIYQPPQISYTYLVHLDRDIANRLLRDSHFKHYDYLFEANKAGQLWSTHSMVNTGLARMEEAYNKAVREGKFDPNLWWALGNLYREMDRYESAEKIYKDHIEQDPGSIEAHIGLGACLLARGEKREAEKIFNEWGKKLPLNRRHELYQIKGAVYLWKLNDLKSAEENLKLFMKYAPPDNPKPLMEMGYLRLLQGDLSSARSLFKKLVTIAKPRYYARIQIATTYGRAGYPDQALEQIKAAQDGIEKLLPKVRSAMYYRCAFILYHLEKTKEGIHCAELSRKFDPTNPEPLVLLSRLYRAKGDLESAKTLLDKALELDPDNEQTLLEIEHPDKPDPSKL